jgi:hypothetical protein
MPAESNRRQKITCTVGRPALQWRRMPALRPRKITFAEMRDSGLRGVPFCCQK